MYATHVDDGPALERVVEAVFVDHLELDLESVDPWPRVAHVVEAGMWLARVELSGGWRGQVDLYADEELMQASCGLLLGKRPGAVEPEERDDAWGEIGNLIAGFVLAGLPPGIRLSRPEVHRVDAPPDLGRPVSHSHHLVEGLPLALFVYSHPHLGGPPCRS